MASSMRQTTRKTIKPLDKRVPTNPKYANVRSKLDTGSSASKAKEKADYIAERFKYRPDEIFRRIKCNTLVQLMLEVADQDGLATFEEHQLDEAATMPGFQGQAQGSSYGYDDQSIATGYSVASSFASFATGQGELRSQAKPKLPPVDTTCPYLLLDLRDKSDYDQCHIMTAHSFPHTRLSRATNMLTRIANAYKNKEGKIIVVYDEDEGISCRAATILVQQGIENLFMLSGGLRVLAEKYPEGLVVGQLPAHLAAKAQKGKVMPISAPLTESNLDQIRCQLEENLLIDDAKSTASSRATSRAASRNTSRKPTRQGQRKPSMASSTKTWR